MTQISGHLTACRRSSSAQVSPPALADFNALILLLTGLPQTDVKGTPNETPSDGESTPVPDDDQKKEPANKKNAFTRIGGTFQVELAFPEPQQLPSWLLANAAAAGAVPGGSPNPAALPANTPIDGSNDSSPGAPRLPALTLVQPLPFFGAISAKTGEVSSGIQTTYRGAGLLAFAAQLTEIVRSTAKTMNLTGNPQPPETALDKSSNIAGPFLDNERTGPNLEPSGASQRTSPAANSPPAAAGLPGQPSTEAREPKTAATGAANITSSPNQDIQTSLSELELNMKRPAEENAPKMPMKVDQVSSDAPPSPLQLTGPTKEKAAFHQSELPGSMISNLDSRSVASHRPMESVAEKAPPGREEVPGANYSWKVESKSEINPNLRPPPAREISLRLLGGESGSVDLRIMERAGKLQIAVRTPDADLAKSLRSDISDLVGRLERRGFETQTWLPGETASGPAAKATDGSSFESGNSRHSNQDGNSQRDPQQQRQRNRPAWLDEMEAKGNGQKFLQGEGDME